MKSKYILKYLTLSGLLIVLLSACTKELTPIGIDLLPGDQLLKMGYTDTATIIAYSEPEDSVYTQKLNYAMVGSMYDPVFGKTDASFYSQLLITTTRVRFGTDPVYDSAFLYLPYYAAYGDTLSNMTLKVYQLTENLYDSVQKYSNSKVSYDKNNPLGEITFQPRPHDSAYYNGTSQAPGIRIPINKRFGDVVFSADTTSLNTITDFNSFFKGICIVAEPQNNPGKGAIIALNVPSENSRLVMYYHNSVDTVPYRFGITTESSRINRYDHNGYAEALPSLRAQLQGNKALGEQFLYLQGMGGIKVRILMPGLKKWFNSDKIVVNDAQLIIGNASPSSLFLQPPALNLRQAGENGGISPFGIVDEGEAYFDGNYESSNSSYGFRITRYVQQVMLGKINNDRGLFLYVPSSEYTGARLVLSGRKSPQTSMKLYLRFTKVN